MLECGLLAETLRSEEMGYILLAFISICCPSLAHAWFPNPFMGRAVFGRSFELGRADMAEWGRYD